MYRELIPLLGDGLITTDDEYHERSRRLMLPVFHRASRGCNTGNG
jgi:cytochrome P450